MEYKDIKHIIFDLDNTLWDFTGNSKRILAEIFDHFDLSSRKKIDFELFHKQYKFRNEFLWHQYAFGNASREEVRFNRFYATLNDFGINDYQLASNAADYYINNTRNQKELLPGTLDVLNYLSLKYELHIITNGFDEVQFFKLKNSGIEAFFKTVTTAESANALKPDKRIFDHALHLMQADPSQCIYIGDSPEVDGTGSVNAGMNFIWLDTEGRENSNNFRKVNGLNELVEML